MSSLARILATLLGIVVGSAAAFAGQEIRFKGPRSFGTVQPQAVVSEDFDGDGHLDVVGIDDGTPYFFRGDGHGSYAEEVVSTPQLDVEPGDAVAADFDGDGHLDVVVCTLETPGGVYPFLGNGDGTFVEAPVIASERSRRIVAADFDENGVDDVVVVHLDTGVLQVLLSNGDGTFTETSIATSGIETDLVAADFDGDGHADLAGLAESGGTTIEVRPGRGDGTFEEPVRTEVGGDHRGLVAVDVDLDSDLDLVLGDRFDFETYLNDGSGQFVEGSETLPVRFVQRLLAADFDEDAIPDVLTVSGGVLSVFLGDATGAFEYSRSFALPGGGNVVQGDFDEDGRPDLVVSEDEGMARLAIAFGDPQGRFDSSRVVQVRDRPESAVAGDFDNDGRTDYAVASNESRSIEVFLTGSGGIGSERVTTTVPDWCPRIATADFDGDGNLDVVVTTGKLGLFDVRVYLGDGTGAFTQSYSDGLLTEGASIAIGNLDDERDGHLDFLVGLENLGRVESYFGNGDGTFERGDFFSTDEFSGSPADPRLRR